MIVLVEGYQNFACAYDCSEEEDRTLELHSKRRHSEFRRATSYKHILRDSEKLSL